MGKKGVNKWLPSAKRLRLHRLVRSLYRERTGRDPFEPGATVRLMVRVLTDGDTGGLSAWEWIATQDDGRSVTTKPTRKPKFGPSFYDSKEWRAARFVALRASNGSCELCGQSHREHGIVLHVDHIKPRSLYPQLELDPENLQVLCEACNLGKSNRDDTDWRIGQ
jgi:hypothetical protein